MVFEKVLIEHGTTPYGFGIGQNGEDVLFISSPCCGLSVFYPVYPSDRKFVLSDLEEGVPDGRAAVYCEGCNTYYRGFSNTICTISILPKESQEYYIVTGFIEPWTGLKNVRVEVTE